MKKNSNTKESKDQSIINETSNGKEKSESSSANSESPTFTKINTAESSIKSHVIASMTLGLIPIPVFDLGALVANQIKMVHSLCKLYEVPFVENRVKIIVASLIGGSIPVFGTIGLSSGAKLIPGIGTLLGSGVVSTTGGALTYSVGKVFVKHFESGGTLLTFDTKKMRSLFKKELDKGNEVAEELDADSQAATTAKAS